MTTDILHDYRSTIEHLDMPKGKKKVLLAAIALFASQGFNGTSTAQIAQTAEVSQATIFKYFKTKDDLLLAILSPIAGLLQTEFTHQSMEMADLESFVHFAVQDRFALVAANRALFQILLQEVTINAEIRKLAQEIFGQTFAQLAPHIRQLGKQDPQFDSSLTDAAIMRIFIGQLATYFIQRFVLHMPTLDEAADLALIERQILKLLNK